MIKILVIDDEKSTLSMFRLFLTAYGYQVIVSEDGKRGLELFEQEQPQIVFTDLKMPGMDGIEVLRLIRSFNNKSNFADNKGSKGKGEYIGQNSATQVIIITGHGDADKAIEALDLDASDFINKPVEKRALESALKRAELRIRQDTSQSTLVQKIFGTTLYLEIYGKLTSTSSVAEQLNKNCNKSGLGDKSFFNGGSVLNDTDLILDGDSIFRGVNQLDLKFSSDFSINRDGIGWLTGFIEWVQAHGIQITMSGLSYNYIRFFQMVGLHEIANIVEAKYDE